jgi:branched-chain amino acid transport system permease protein
MTPAIAGVFVWKGTPLGGAVLGIIESLGAGYIGDLTGEFPGSHYQDIFAFIVLIVVLVFRPSGLLGAPTLRLRGDYLAIVTLGFGEIVRICLNNLNAPVNLTNGPQGISHIEPIHLGGVSLAKTQEWFGVEVPSVYLYDYAFLALALLIIVLTVRLQDSRFGRAWMAMREDEIAAKAMDDPRVREAYLGEAAG